MGREKSQAKPMTLDELIQASPQALQFWCDIATRSMIADVLLEHMRDTYDNDEYNEQELIDQIMEWAANGTRGYHKMGKPELVAELKDLIYELTQEPLTPEKPRG